VRESERDISDQRFSGSGRSDGEMPVNLTKSGSMNKEKDNQVVGRVRIINKMGLHARPAMQMVDLSNKFSSRIRICKDRQCVNAKSIMELLLLAACDGTELTIQAEGPDAADAVDALTKLVESKFDEE